MKHHFDKSTTFKKISFKPIKDLFFQSNPHSFATFVFLGLSEYITKNKEIST